MPRCDAVFEGGGVKGIGLVGAVAVTEDMGYEFCNVAGTSAGAIVAALVAAGYRASELRDIIRSLDYTQFKDEGLLDNIPRDAILTAAAARHGDLDHHTNPAVT